MPNQFHNIFFHICVIGLSFLICRAYASTNAATQDETADALGIESTDKNLFLNSMNSLSGEPMMLPVLRRFRDLREQRARLRDTLMLDNSNMNGNNTDKNLTSHKVRKHLDKLKSLFNLRKKVLQERISSDHI